jgi:hypothetical protein
MHPHFVVVLAALLPVRRCRTVSPVQPHAHAARPTSIPASLVVVMSMRCLLIGFVRDLVVVVTADVADCT